MNTVQAGAQLGNTGWRLVGMSRGEESCQHCGRALKHLYRVANPDGRVLVVGRGCVKKLTGWTLEAAEAARLLRLAERDARRTANWARFEAEHPEQAATIQADVAEYERRAPREMGAGASHEVWHLIGDRYAENPEWVNDFVAGYLQRRLTFWWVRGASLPWARD